MFTTKQNFLIFPLILYLHYQRASQLNSLLCVCFSLISPAWFDVFRPETEEYIEEQSRVAKDILDNYDLRFIPARNGLYCPQLQQQKN
jgi:hypothetical protein